MIKVLIADDHKMFVDGVKLILEKDSDILVTGEARDGHEVVYHLQQEPADVLMLDIDMPKKDGAETVETIKKLNPDTKILIVTMHDQPSHIKNMIDQGVDGYMLKNADQQELRQAVHLLSEGKEYYSPGVLQKLIHYSEENRSEQGPTHPRLSERESEIIRLTAQGKSIAEISDELFISVNTVKSHRKNIMRKLDVHNAAGIAKFAGENGLA